VRAGLGLVAAVTQLRPGRDLALQVRVGIATGLVVVGEKIGSGAAQEETVVGETPNLAARLQAEAGPNSVVIVRVHAACSAACLSAATLASAG
jgi:class 3 adenylate cyclase